MNWDTIDAGLIEEIVARDGEATSGGGYWTPYVSAGGFSIEDPDLAPLVASIDGTIDSVKGLPMAMLFQLLDQVKAGENADVHLSRK